MTYRQKVLKAIYPAFMWLSKGALRNSAVSGEAASGISFYSLESTRSNGERFLFSGLKGKKIVIVNTASDCGFTGQYAQLQELAERYSNSIVVIAFPANDFRQQEKGTDHEIAAFCKVNYGITFPLMKKGTVVKARDQQPVFQWLSEPVKNGWNASAPTWNFCKYIVSEQGELTGFFGPSVSPLSDTFIQAIEKK